MTLSKALTVASALLCLVNWGGLDELEHSCADVLICR